MWGTRRSNSNEEPDDGSSHSNHEEPQHLFLQRQALLSPSTPEDVHRGTGRRRRRPQEEDADETEPPPPPPNYSHPPPFPDNLPSGMSHGSFNETSFSFSNFFRWQHQAGGEEDSEEEEGDDDNPNHPLLLESYDDTWLSRYNGWLQPHRRWLLLFAIVVLWPCGLFWAFPRFQNATDSSVVHTAVSGSPSAEAAAAFGRAYANDRRGDDATTNHPPLVLVLEAANNTNGKPLAADLDALNAYSLTHNGTAAYRQARSFSRGLRPYLLQRDPCWTAASENNTQNESSAACDDWLFLRVASYYSVVEEQDLPPWIARGTWAVGSSVVLLEIEYTFDDDNNSNNNQKSSSSSLQHHRHRDRKKTKKNDKQRVLELMDAVDDYQREFWQNATTNHTNHTNNATEPQPQQQHYFTVHYTGLKYFSSDLALSTRHDLRRMDCTVLPLALVWMGVVLPAAHPAVLWIIPVVTMLSTVSMWSLLMQILVHGLLPNISAFTPTVMMSLTFGVSIDYTLFLLARYLKEMEQESSQRRGGGGRRRRRAIARMLAGSGHVLVLSGLTLAATFGGLVFLPLDLLKSVGVGAAVTILSALVVNLVLVPTLLYTPLGLWIIVAKPPRDGRFEEQQQQQQSAQPAGLSFEASDQHHLRDGDAGNSGEEPLLSPHRRQRSRLFGHEQQLEMPRTLWFRLSKQLLHPYRGIILLLLACQLLLPIAQHAGQIKSSISFDLMLPAKSPSLQTFHALGAKVGLGRLNPYRVLFDGREANITMTSNAGFQVMHLVLDALRAIDRSDNVEYARCLREIEDTSSRLASGLDMDEMERLAAQIFIEEDGLIRQQELCQLEARRPKPTSYNGISVLENVNVPHALFVSAKYCSQMKPHCPLQLLHALNALDEQATSPDEYATFLTATLGSSPFSDEGVAWLEHARATLDRLDREDVLSGVNIYLEGSAGIAHDAVNAVYSAFPLMIGITMLVIFGLMGVFFKSIFVPIRSIVSIGLTLAFSFGLAVCVFQDGALNWTNVRVLTSIGDEVCWLVPIMAFSILIGLALDYDVFLISRVLEFRLEGHEHRTSIALGLDSTGGIIAAAGVIMAVAFGSLLFSSNPVLYQWSFILTTGVLLHTFFVEPIVVPILTGLSGKHCWWPRRLPEEHICYTEFHQDHDSDDVAGLLRSLESTSEYEPLRAA